MTQTASQPDEEVLSSLEEVSQFSEITDELGDMLRAFAKKKERKKEIESELKDINKEMETLNEQLVNLFNARGVHNIKLSGFGTFYQYSKAYVSVKDDSQLIEWLDLHGEGAIAKRSVHHATLNSWYNERLQQGDDVPGETILGAFVKTGIGMRKGK